MKLRSRTVVTGRILIGIAASLSLISSSTAGGVDTSHAEACRSTSSVTAYRYYKRGSDDFKAGALNKAIANLDKAIKIDPDFGCALDRRAIAHAAAGHNKMALADFTSVIRLQPNSAIALNNRGYFYESIGDLDDAIRDLSGAIRLNQNYADAYGNRAGAYVRNGKYNDAIRDFSEQIRIEPSNSSALYNRGVIYGRLERHRDAIADFSSAIQIKPDKVGALSGRCWEAAVLAEDLNGALADCDAALKIERHFYGALQTRGFVYLRLGRYDDAIRDYDEYLGHNPKSAYALYGRGIARIRKGDRIAGTADISAAKKLDAKITKSFADYDVTP